jgi:23S rRNA pseudouridine955/2504/2580 synthase|tara:strand:- start:1784 stop:2719 length:936 start_codon:yes stop_codon:yes gene_type:complete
MLENVQKVEIQESHEGQRLDNFLINYLKGVPKSKIYSIIRKGEVRVNSSRKKAKYKLNVKDLVRIPPIRISASKDKIAPRGMIDLIKENIISENDYYIAINKPIGIASHGGSGISIGLIEAIRNFGPEYRDCKLVHRLDKSTSGCQLIAKKQQFLKKCNEYIRDGKVIKRYTAIVLNEWPEEIRKITSNLSKDILISGERMVKESSAGKQSITEFKIKKKSKKFTKLECNLITGRTHQIRVHTSNQGNPIVGDDKYGNKEINKFIKKIGLERMYLHSNTLIIPDLKISLEAEEPVEFKKLIKISDSELNLP